MSQNNPHRTSPRFNSSSANNTFNLTASNFNTRNSPTRMSGKRNKIFSTSSQDPDCVAAAASILSQSDLNNIHPNNMQFYLQKLDLLYQNLEGRIQKLENILSEQIFGVDSGVINPNNSHFNAIINAHPSIDNSSTSGNNFEFNPATIVPSNCSTSSTSSICSILEPVPKEISKSDLDDYCLSLLQKRAAPSIGELNSIVMNLKKLKYPDLDNKFILSKVREWFRRKREYMSQRIFNICSKKFSHLINNPIAVKELLHKARNNPEFVAEIGREANLEILNEAAAWEFCSEKISSYLASSNTSTSKNIFDGNDGLQY